MAIPQWQAGTLYQPGDIVIPITQPSPTATVIVNGDFSSGSTGWTFEDDAEYDASTGYAGNGCVRLPGNVTDGTAVNDTQFVAPTGQSITAACMIQQGAAVAGATRGWAEVRWYDSDDLLIKADKGNVVDSGKGGAWHQSSVTSTCPSGAAYAKAAIALWSVGDHSHSIWGDKLTVSGTFAGLPEGLAYKAVQAESGYSAGTEPEWPPILGQTVVDNDVTWEAIAISRVTWVASPLYVSGSTEPDWPTDIGAYVHDGTINWKAISRRVEDENCPQSKAVVIASSKVFAADDDIIAYSETVNPLNWTTADDAGYLPFGLQLYGANPCMALGLYRGNLAAFNAQGCQLWQVDEDPSLMQRLDALPLGTQYHHALAPVSNDLFLLTNQGVRTVGIAGGTTNLQAGDVGSPIDPLVQEALKTAEANGIEPMALYNPNAGQYWLMFVGQPASGQTLAFVHTINQLGKVGAWTRYVFPFVVTDWCILGNDLYLRSGDEVRRVTRDRESDEVIDGGATTAQPFEWAVQWPWLDFGAMGVTKMMQGFDIIGTGTCSIEFGYDQTNGESWTPAWTLNADSVPGQLLPMPLAAPSMAVRITFQGNDVTRTGWEALNVHLASFRSTA